MSKVLCLHQTRAVPDMSRHTVTFHTRIARALVWFVSVPCIVLTILSVYFFQHGTHVWFDRRFRDAMTKADELVLMYFKEQEEVNHAMAKVGYTTIQRSIKSVHEARDPMFGGHVEPPVVNTPVSFSLFLGEERFQTLTREMAAISQAQNATYWIIHRPPTVASSALAPVIPSLLPPLFQSGLQRVGILDPQDLDLDWLKKQGWPIRLTRNFRFIMKVYPLKIWPDTYMVMVRPVSNKLLGYSSDIHRIAEEYKNMAQANHQIVYSGMIFFVALSLLCMMTAVGWGLLFSRQSIRPITALMEASLLLRQGQTPLITVADYRKSPKELQHLLMSFNQLSQEVAEKTHMLHHANDALKTRNHFIEGVLESLSSGVLVLHQKNQVLFHNTPAQRLFPNIALDEQPHVLTLLPDLESVLASIDHITPMKEVSLTLTRDHQTKTYHLYVHWIPEIGHTVLSIDDISDLISAQKKSAWSDVACRIAHEIKNPLTPIALSAERLKRRLGSLDDEDRDIFQDCIDTIIRQAHHIGTLISEFSNFARLPSPQKRQVDFGALLQQITAWHQHAYPNVRFVYDKVSLWLWCDPDQMDQVMNNVLKNAMEAIDEHPQPYQGVIEISLVQQQDLSLLKIIDNGVGLPEDKALTLCEPYLTSKSKGMGLGLAIVQKIIADHEGNFTIQSLHDRTGTCVTITLPVGASSVMGGEN